MKFIDTNVFELFRALPVLPVATDVTEKGLDVMKRYGLQFYDSLLLVSASESGCDELSPRILTTDKSTVE